MHHNVSDIEFLLTLCIAAVFVFACIAMQKPVINYYLKFRRFLLKQELAVSRQVDLSPMSTERATTATAATERATAATATTKGAATATAATKGAAATTAAAERTAT